MKKKTILFLILLLLFAILLIDYGYLQEEEKEGEIYTFITGNKYLLDIPDDQKGAYVIGLLDMYSYLINSFTSEYYLDFVEKIKYMTGIQIQAIFDKYLEEHPELWHFSGAVIFYRAIMEMVYEK